MSLVDLHTCFDLMKHRGNVFACPLPSFDKLGHALPACGGLASLVPEVVVPGAWESTQWAFADMGPDSVFSGRDLKDISVDTEN